MAHYVYALVMRASSILSMGLYYIMWGGQVSQSVDASGAGIGRRCYRRLLKRCGSTTGTIGVSIQQSNSCLGMFNWFKHVGLIN
jgi:hypothetical protein